MNITIPNIVGDIELYMRVLRAICGETEGKSMIDLGCCFAPNTPKLGFSKRTYVDVIERVLDHHEEQQFFIKADIVEFMNHATQWPDIKWDVAIATDVTEHLTIENAYKLLYDMAVKSHKQIIFTPLGELWLEKICTNNPEAHRSAWRPEMLRPYFGVEWASIVFQIGRAHV